MFWIVGLYPQLTPVVLRAHVMERLVALPAVTLCTTLNDGAVRLLAERTSAFLPRSTDVLDPTDEAGEVEKGLTW